ncbi:hypothetical protein FRC00_002186 [Tulasnella sp. 408]|nr:hypothetical protein FRC00_002186 [Tulasnella sp. 408]
MAPPLPEDGLVESWQAGDFTFRHLYTRTGIQAGLVDVVKGLGDVYLLRRKYSKVGSGGVADAVYRLGEVYGLREEHSKAEKLYIASRNIYSQPGDKLGFANAITGLGQLLAMKESDTDAEELYREAREIYTEIGTRDALANNL